MVSTTTAIGRLRRPSSIQVYAVYVFYVASLHSAQVYFLVFTQFTLCHEPVMLLMLRAVTLDQSMKIVKTFFLENRTTWRAHFSHKKFAIDSFDNPEEELFLTCTVVTQFERPYLPFLPILAKCDLWRIMALYRTMLKHLGNVFK